MAGWLQATSRVAVLVFVIASGADAVPAAGDAGARPACALSPVAALGPGTGGYRAAVVRPCPSDTPCCPQAIQPPQRFCRIGCPGPPPKKLVDVKPDMSTVSKPHPMGIVIVEVALDEGGVPISACVRHSVRPDFDRAAENAVMKWRFEPKTITRGGPPIGVVMTVMVVTPRQR